MGRIQLRQDLARNTPIEVKNPNLTGALESINASNRATDYLVRGSDSVNNALSRMFAETKNEDIQVDNVNANARRIELTNAKLNEFAQERIDSPDSFKTHTAYAERVSKIYDDVDNDMLSWGEKNLRWQESKTAVEANNKMERARGFAQSMGEFLRENAQRNVRDINNNIELEITNLNESNAHALIDKLPGATSEMKGTYKKQATFNISNNKLDILKGELSTLSSPENVAEKIKQIKASAAYKGVSDSGRSEFDIFAIVANNRAGHLSAQAKKVAISGEKTIAKDKKDASQLEVKGLKANIGLAAQESQRLAKMCIDDKGVEYRLNEIISNSNFTDDEKAIARKDVMETLNDTKISTQKNIQAMLRKQAFDALESAQKNDGFIDSSILKDAKLSQKRREAELIGNYENMKEEQKSDFSGKFFSLLKRANAYSSKESYDNSGKKLTELMREAQVFPANHRKQIMQLLYESSNAISPNEKWSDGDVKEFKNQFSEFCELNNDSGYLWWKEEADPITYLDLQNRIMHLAKIRGLSLNESIKELKEDPLYKSVMLKVNKQKALEFIKK